MTSYPQWVTNVVPIPNKDDKVRMCVDYRDLNRESPEDDFPLPHIDVLVDNTAQHKVFSFMDSFSRYNQINMAPEDMEKTTFLLLGHAFWVEECWGNLSACHGSFISRHDSSRDRGLNRRQDRKVTD